MAENEAAGGSAGGEPRTRIGDDVLLILPVRNLVVFPGSITQVAVGREVSLAATREAVANERPLGILLQHDPSVDEPGPDDLYRTGTVVSAVRFLTAPSGMNYLICQGEHRFRVVDFVGGLPFLAARYERVSDVTTATPRVEALFETLRSRAQEALGLLPQAPPELATSLSTIDSPGVLAHLVAGLFDFKPQEKQTLLETTDIQPRLEKLLELMTHRLRVLELSHEIGEQTQEKLDERQREYLLREHSMVRSYLDWLTSLPWSKESEESIDIEKARAILDEDHYGLDKLKRRILEYLAVRKLNPEGRSPILCLVGPPGVGKTSLGESIARALGLGFVRASWRPATTRCVPRARAAPRRRRSTRNRNGGAARATRPASGPRAARIRRPRPRSRSRATAARRLLHTALDLTFGAASRACAQ